MAWAVQNGGHHSHACVRACCCDEYGAAGWAEVLAHGSMGLGHCVSQEQLAAARVQGGRMPFRGFAGDSYAAEIHRFLAEMARCLAEVRRQARTLDLQGPADSLCWLAHLADVSLQEPESAACHKPAEEPQGA